MLRFADTSVRLYRKRDWSVSVRLRSYLMIHCKGGQGFRLGAYLNQLEATLTLSDGQIIKLEEYGFTDECVFEMDHMIHEFWASGTASLESIQDGAARLQVEYRLFSSPGQGDPDRIDLVVPILARGVYAQRWARRKRAA
ncbi:hypothetical protein KAK07_24995 [Ideonella sp. 4Y16]|uniref:hypothetical protein n=1 Tax=Ideonella alba TaxID=2824118 RepID=UPI001B36125A|nr:hypothetical protein [Ideonella alba]MBQ0946607.1 hypothetical protein [Ideonella alba]